MAAHAVLDLMADRLPAGSLSSIYAKATQGNHQDEHERDEECRTGGPRDEDAFLSRPADIAFEPSSLKQAGAVAWQNTLMGLRV